MSSDTLPSFDRPIDGPGQDLLGTRIYARQLARYILKMDPNFTVGVYGQWGSGKTSFAHLIKHELGDQVRFIDFMAWPYRTSDELWRALILTIARALYDQPAPSWSEPPPKRSLVERCSAFLNRIAFGGEDRPGPARPFATYEDLIAALDATLAGSIRKSPFRAFADEDQAMLTIVKTVAATVSLVSPPFGEALKALLVGEDTKEDASRKEANATTRSRIESIATFQSLLRELFKRKAADKRVCVFVDDLDRCMPDVALDLLEAIQIFLGNVNCVFIVAADQELIGQGLRARFRDLVETAQSDQDREFYARKGREYFEKVIQFGVPVPEPGLKEGYRFIGAHFPEWTASADLVISALGANPRRLKQYVGLLDYRYGVAMSLQEFRGPLPSGSSNRRGLREKLTAIWWREPRIGEVLAALASSPADFVRETQEVEFFMKGSGSLYGLAIQNGPAMDLLRAQPRLSLEDPLAVETILRFADLQPGPQSTLVTRDAPFLRLIAPLLLGLPVTEEGLEAEDVNRLVILDRQAPLVVDALIELAQDRDYTGHMQEVERLSGDSPTFSVEARLYFTDSALEPGELARRRGLLTTEPLLSSIPNQVVQAYGRVRPVYLRQPKIQFGPEVKTAYQHRIEAAEGYAARRRFAKVDVLIHGWPELAVYLTFDRTRLLALEDAVINDRFEGEWLQRFRRDEALIRFLRLRPQFDELYPGEVKKAAAVAQQSAVETIPPTPQQAIADTAPMVAQQPVIETPAPTVPPAPLAETQEPEIVGPAEPVQDSETIFLQVVQTPDGISRSFAAMAWDESGAIAAESWTFQLDVPSDLLWRVDEPSELELRYVGKALFDAAFRGVVRERITAMLKRKLRLIVDLSSASGNLSALPWEALNADDVFPAVDGRLQVIRYMAGNRAATTVMGSKMRMLAVIAAPRDVGMSSEVEARSLLDRVLAPATDRGVLQYSALQGEIALKRVFQELLDNPPNIFHFFGHGSINSVAGEGGILFGSEHSEFVGAGQVVDLFGKVGSVRLAVLLGSETGSGREVGVQNSVAGRLVMSGVPAVIGTLRNISTRSALLFSRRFYSTLLETGEVERALADARRALAREKWDWSAYALFSDVTRFDRLPFPPTST